MEPQSSPTGFCGNENLEIPYQSLKERHEGKGPDLAIRPEDFVAHPSFYDVTIPYFIGEGPGEDVALAWINLC